MPKQYDPRMHSAEHILNQTMVRMFNCGRSFEAHIEKDKSRCYYHLDHSLRDEEIQAVERQVNEIIRRDLEVTEEYMSREEAGKHFNLRRVPEDTGETLRIVRIGDYDACPCIGPHVQRTKDIGVFRLYSTSYGDGVLKVRFKLLQE